jgi:hypothetical protein
LGERLLCKQEVIGSIPFTSTIGTSTIGTSTIGHLPPGPATYPRLAVRPRHSGAPGGAPAAGTTFGEVTEIPFPGDPRGGGAD